MVSTKFLVDTKMDRRSMVVAGEPIRITKNGRRYFSRAHKEAVLAKCLESGASLAAVALANGLNANLVRKWVRQGEALQSSSAQLVPVVIDPERTVPRTADKRVRPTRPGDGGSIQIRKGTIELVVQGIVDRAQLSVVLEALLRAR